MNVAPCALLEGLTYVPQPFVDLDERIRRQLASVAVATTLRRALSCCVALGVMASATPASAQQPSCDDWGTKEFFFPSDPNATTVARCLKAGADVHARTKLDEFGSGGKTALHLAATWNEDPAVVKVLLEAGADVHARDRSVGSTPDATPLHAAASHSENPAVISALLEAGADVQARTVVGATPLHNAAAHNRNPAVIELLLEAGADVHVRDDLGGTLLHSAASSVFGESAVIVELLLDAGADIHAQDVAGSTPLHDAGVFGNSAMITALLAAGADPDARNKGGYTPMDKAGDHASRWNTPTLMDAFSEQAVAAYKAKRNKAKAEANAREIAEQMRSARTSCEQWNTAGFFTTARPAEIAACAQSESLEAKNDQGRTPMHLAALHGTAAAVAALAEVRADPNALDGKGRTPLHLVAVFGTDPEIVAALVRAGADLDAQDAKGRTPLEFAEKFSETPAIVAALREAMAGANARSETTTPSADAEPMSCGDWNTAAFFRRATSDDVARCLETEDPNARNRNGRTPMHYAAQSASPALVTALAQAGAELNAPDAKGGWTPLHLAAWFSTTPSVVAALLAAGADPAARDKAGKTPWDYARENAALEGTPPYWRLNEEGAE